MQLIRPLLLITLLLTGQSGWAGTFSQIGTSRWVTVGKVYDGDTFKTRKGEKVRLLGINTPEVARDDKPGQPLADQATNELRKLVLGKTVRLEFDAEQHDSYGRLLAHVFLRDGRWINAHMIESGLAHAYTFAPNFRHAARLLIKERQARDEKRGIWNIPRFKVLSSNEAGRKQIGQFRVVTGSVDSIKKNSWGFRLNHIHVSIPRAHRKWFKTAPKLKYGDIVVVHGKIRISNWGKLYLALHSPFDLEILE
ncbi:MAG: thermonuclease family protein [Mariprofundaceae bacterium]|nr:thermonuclease family protein [Mariprofundaceae bacterium]